LATKEILKVDLDTSAFDEFRKKFNEYEAAVKGLPAQWQASGAEITAQKTHFEEMTDSIRGSAQELVNLVSSQGKMNALLDGSSIALVGMAKSGRQFAGHIFQATASLRHWTKLTALFAGVIGAGASVVRWRHRRGRPIRHQPHGRERREAANVGCRTWRYLRGAGELPKQFWENTWR
jgi:hypothetical protein